MARDIFVPIDGTDVSKQALEYALSEYPEASFTVFHVLSTDSQAETFVDDGVDRDDVEAAAAELLDRAREIADEYDIEIEVTQTTGSPPRAIVDQAESEEYDLIVMGTHGRRGTERMLAGSVAEKVIRTSPIPVLVYR